MRDTEAAEEVVQEALVAGLENLHQYAGKGTEHAWLLGILKRKIIDQVRQRNRTVSMVTSEGDDLWESLFDAKGAWKGDPRIFGPEPSGLLERQEFRQVLQDCLDGLPPRQAGVFVLREMDGLSSDEICKELEISPSNLWVLLHRARLRLATCLKSRWQA